MFLNLLGLFVASLSLASELNESLIVNRIKETSAHKTMQSRVDGTSSQSQLVRAKFQPVLQGHTSYAESREEPLFQFSPVISPQRSSSIGIAQKLPIGVSAKIEGFSDQITIPAFDVDRASRSGGRLSLEMDLLSNFLGERDWSEFKNAKIKQQVATMQGDMNRQALIQDFRKAYWSYMGLEESLKIADELLSSAQKQYKEILARKKVGAADQNDIARSQAQVSGRQTQMSVIEYQKAQIFQQLKQQYPEVDRIPYVSTLFAQKQVEDCIQKIKNEKNYADKSTYNELVSLLEEEKKYALKQVGVISDWDLKLQGLYQKNSVGQGFTQSQDGFWINPREAYQVGLQLSIPLGGGQAAAEKHSVSEVTLGYDAQITNLKQQILTQHQRALKSMSYLEAAVGTQVESIKSLRASVRSSQTKYAQARISQIEYILEQDKLFGTEVESIQNRLQIINETLDYLKTFNKQKCQFNRIAGI